MAFKRELGRHINFNKKGGWHATDHKDNITFSKTVYPNGIDSIIKELETTYGVIIKPTGFRGNPPAGFIRYNRITWEPKKQKKQRK